jgi:hypothetical protein
MNILKLPSVYDNKTWSPANNVVFKIGVSTLIVNSFCQNTTLKRLGARDKQCCRDVGASTRKKDSL